MVKNKHRENLKFNGQKIFEVDKMLFHTSVFLNLSKLIVTLSKLGECGIQDSHDFTIIP